MCISDIISTKNYKNVSFRAWHSDLYKEMLFCFILYATSLTYSNLKNNHGQTMLRAISIEAGLEHLQCQLLQSGGVVWKIDLSIVSTPPIWVFRSRQTTWRRSMMSCRMICQRYVPGGRLKTLMTRWWEDNSQLDEGAIAVSALCSQSSNSSTLRPPGHFSEWMKRIHTCDSIPRKIIYVNFKTHAFLNVDWYNFWKKYILNIMHQVDKYLFGIELCLNKLHTIII